jgi:hypothetical protein
MKEIIVLLLWRYWTPNDYGKMEELLKSCSLLFYKMESLVSTVNAYVMNLKKALEGRPYDKQIVSELILPNIEPSFVNWINKIRDQYQSWTSYEELFKFLEGKASKAQSDFKEDGIQIKKMQFPKVAGGAQDHPSKSQVKGITDDKKSENKRYPKDNSNYTCPICDKVYKKNPGPNEQNHGFASNYSGTVGYCLEWDTKPEKVKLYLAEREKEIKSKKK